MTRDQNNSKSGATARHNKDQPAKIEESISVSVEVDEEKSRDKLPGKVAKNKDQLDTKVLAKPQLEKENKKQIKDKVEKERKQEDKRNLKSESTLCATLPDASKPIEKTTVEKECVQDNAKKVNKKKKNKKKAVKVSTQTVSIPASIQPIQQVTVTKIVDEHTEENIQISVLEKQKVGLADIQQNQSSKRISPVKDSNLIKRPPVHDVEYRIQKKGSVGISPITLLPVEDQKQKNHHLGSKFSDNKKLQTPNQTEEEEGKLSEQGIKYFAAPVNKPEKAQQGETVDTKVQGHGWPHKSSRNCQLPSKENVLQRNKAQEHQQDDIMKDITPHKKDWQNNSRNHQDKTSSSLSYNLRAGNFGDRREDELKNAGKETNIRNFEAGGGPYNNRSIPRSGNERERAVSMRNVIVTNKLSDKLEVQNISDSGIIEDNIPEDRSVIRENKKQSYTNDRGRHSVRGRGQEHHRKNYQDTEKRYQKIGYRGINDQGNQGRAPEHGHSVVEDYQFQGNRNRGRGENRLPNDAYQSRNNDQQVSDFKGWSRGQHSGGSNYRGNDRYQSERRTNQSEQSQIRNHPLPRNTDNRTYKPWPEQSSSSHYQQEFKNNSLLPQYREKNEVTRPMTHQEDKPLLRGYRNAFREKEMQPPILQRNVMDDRTQPKGNQFQERRYKYANSLAQQEPHKIRDKSTNFKSDDYFQQFSRLTLKQ